MNLVCIPTKGISSGGQLAEALFQCAQEAMHPNIPRKATEWFYTMTLLDLNAIGNYPAFRRVEEAFWRMLLLYTVQDLAEHSRSQLVVADLARMLNTIRHTRGRNEVLTICDALQSVRRSYPQVFAHT